MGDSVIAVSECGWWDCTETSTRLGWPEGLPWCSRIFCHSLCPVACSELPRSLPRLVG